MTHTLTALADTLVAGTIYKFKFTAINSIGNSADSEIVQFSLCDTPLAPAAPTSIISLTNSN